ASTAYHTFVAYCAARSVAPIHGVGRFAKTAVKCERPIMASADVKTIVAIVYQRNDPRKAMAPRMIAARRNGSIAKSPCIMSVDVGCDPRMCIGKKFQRTRASSAFSAIIADIH